MSHRTLLLVVGAVVVAACDRSIDATSPMKSPRAASFDRPTINTVTPTSDVVINPCNGDVVTLTGDAHVLLKPTNTGTELHINFSDLTGVGVPSGLVYHENGVGDQTTQVTGTGLTFETQINEELISQGSANNFIVHTTVIFDGTSVTFKRSSTECRG